MFISTPEDGRDALGVSVHEPYLTTMKVGPGRQTPTCLIAPPAVWSKPIVGGSVAPCRIGQWIWAVTPILLSASDAASFVTRSRCKGCPRGGLTTKLHAVVDANDLPISLALSEGQPHAEHSAHLLLDTLTPGSVLLADRAYDAGHDRPADRGGLLGETVIIRPRCEHLHAPAPSALGGDR